MIESNRLMKKTFIFIGLCLFSISLFAVVKHVKIVAVNDMHANLQGVPRFAAFMDSIRGVDKNVVLLSAGDNRTGNPYNDKYNPTSKPMTMLMNELGFEASAIGNHEFDGEIAGFRENLNNSNFPYLCANIFLPDTCRLHVYPYKIMDVGGVRLGIIGGVQLGPIGIPDCHPDDVRGVKFKPINDVLPQYRWMREQCDVLILLSHDGYEVDTVTARLFPYYDVILGGHTHYLSKSNEIHNGVLVTQAKNKLAYVAVVDIDVEDGKVVEKKSEIVNLSNFTGESKHVREMVDGFYNNPELLKVISHIKTAFATKEELANMEMDALREETSADIAIQNGGGVRFASFPAGDFTRGDLLELDPFGNLAVVYELTGAEVESMIMNCYDLDEKQPVYVSGITYEMNIGVADNKEDVHPIDIKIKTVSGKPFSRKAIYKVVTNGYVAAILTAIDRSRGNEMNVTCSDLIEQWLMSHDSLDYSGTKRIKLNFVTPKTK